MAGTHSTSGMGTTRSPLRKVLRHGYTVVRTLQLASDVRSLAAALRASLQNGDGRASAVRVNVRQLGGMSIVMRPGTTDARVALDTFVSRYHWFPEDLAQPKIVWDLGANVGYTMAQFAHMLPHCTVVGVELDHENAELARLNTRPWQSRCTVIWGAVWPTECEVRYRRYKGREAGYRVEAGGLIAVPTHSLDMLLRRTGPPDYVKMDIEGAEELVLTRNTAWAAHVGCISVECHPPYTADSCQRDLAALGFQTIVAHCDRRARDCVIACRQRLCVTTEGAQA